MAARATNQSSDKKQAVVMIEETISNTGVMPRGVSAAAGYYLAKAVDELYALGVDLFVAPEQTRHGRVVPPAPRGRIPRDLSPRNLAGNPDSPQAVIFLASITDVMMGS